MKLLDTKVTKIAAAAAWLLIAAAPSAHAAGMLPESTAVLIDEADGEASMVVKNTDPAPTLLYATIEAVRDDPKPPVVLTPPVARVEPGKTQLVRFMLTNAEPLKVERYARVTFDGIPERRDDGQAKVTLTVRQSLPIVIHPKSLPVEKEPWKRLKWYRDGDALVAYNDSPYVVRMDQALSLQPGAVPAMLPKTYLVPGEQARVRLKDEDNGKAPSLDAVTKVVMTPFTAYGYAAAPYTAVLGAQQQGVVLEGVTEKKEVAAKNN
ncbi:fimbria/pilus chaperone family protein [Burkholderia ubonensis]|uniref:fimbria/pilus chaperone family protein n=1 Tax=Burkholderia ubonensis TaxID=101571 RepID=UPI0007C6702A|nr:fimbria/pilus chaperone family protein [Burkholderia ubonensis]